MRELIIGHRVCVRKPLHHQGSKGVITDIVNDIINGGPLYRVKYDEPRSSINYGYFKADELYVRGGTNPDNTTEGEEP